MTARWRVALRIAYRDARRHRARTLTVLLMIGLPVAVVTAGDVVLRTSDLSSEESIDRELGSADAIVYSNRGAPSVGRARAVLGPGARVLPAATSVTRVRTRLGAIVVDVDETIFTDTMTRGLFPLERGRLPARPGEVAVSAAIDRRFGRTLPLFGRPAATIVGVVGAPYDTDAQLAVGLPGTFELERGATQRKLLVAQPGGVSASQVRALRGPGLSVRARGVADPYDDDGNPDEIGFAALVAVLALLEVVLLAGPAFAVGVRERQHQLALLASAGAGPLDLRRTVLAVAVVLGGLGAVAGAAAGVGLGVLAVPLAQRLTDSRFGSVEIAPLDIVAVALFGLVSAVLAAIVPAEVAARQDPVRALTGRRGEPAPRRGAPLLGVVLVLAGTLLAADGARNGSTDGSTVVAIATVPLVLGMTLLVPAIVAVAARAGRGLPVALRFVLRDAVRNRSRSAPAVAAVAATVVGVTALGIASASDSASRRAGDFAPRGTVVVAGFTGLPAGAADSVRRRLPHAGVRVVDGLPNRPDIEFSGGAFAYNAAFGANVIVATTIGGLGLPDVSAADAVLARGGAVLPRTVHSDVDRTTIRLRRGRSVTVPAINVEGDGAQAIVAPAVARKLGLEVRPHGLLVRGASPGDLQEVMNDVAPRASVSTPMDDPGGVARLILAIVGSLLMLGGTLTATRLALADARPDLATLAAVGAAPRTRRAVSAAYAGTISLAGAVLGALVGAVPGVAAAHASTAGSGTGAVVAIPWLMLAAVVIGLPAFAALVVGTTARSRLPGPQRRI